MRRAHSLSILSGVGLLALGMLFDAPAQTKKKVSTSFEKTVLPLVKKYCYPCHQGKTPSGALDLTRYPTAVSIQKDPDVWDRVARNLASGHMPPAGSAAPTASQRKEISGWIQTFLTANCDVADPGRVTLRRLNRAEYDNTIRDLFGIDFSAADDFPSDDVGYGFDNVGDVLSMSPLLLEKYLRAAEQIASKAIVTTERKTLAVEPDKAEIRGGGRVVEEGVWVFFSNGSVTQDVTPSRSGDYVLRVSAFGQQAGPEPCRMKLLASGQAVGDVSVTQEKGKPGTFEVPLKLGAGPVRIGATFENDYYRPEDPNPGQRDRNLVIESIELVGPLDSGVLPESHRRLILARPVGSDDWTAAARICLKSFVTRAFRRPARSDELDKLVELVLAGKKRGLSYEESMRVGVQAVLVSPSFLFRVEETKSGALDSYQLATRLSYFLWSSMPDQVLFDLASQGSLTKPELLAQQAIRMLKSPRSRGLDENFAAQWLQLRKLDLVTPDRKLFPGFNEELREAMRRETEMFFRSVVEEDRSVLDFLDSNWTFLNERLARHYGVSGVTGVGFRRVNLEDGRRGGLITQASILTVTSNPTRTSPVKRGKWVLENILGTPPPPPPPGAGDLPSNEATNPRTVRERLELHRKNPECASCHARLDPIGFGLENFDAVGGWRTEDGGQPIDTKGQLPDGASFDSPSKLKAYLMAKKDLFVRALAEKMLTFALGRGVEASDQCFVDEIARACKNGGYKFSALVKAIVRSKPFLRQGGRGS